MKHDFTCITVSPAGLLNSAIAKAAVRAGCIGVLDLEFSEDFDRIERNLQDLVTGTDSSCGLPGIRFHIGQSGTITTQLEKISGIPHVLAVSITNHKEFIDVIGRLSENAQSRVIVEVTSVDEAMALKDNGFTNKIFGIIGKGNESGGWVGEDMSFILLQKLLALNEFKVFIQGGVGLYTAAACRAVGAAGIVLDDQLLLMPESPLPSSWKTYIEEEKGDRVVLYGEHLGSPCRVLKRPDFPVVKNLEELAASIEIEHDSSADGRNNFTNKARRIIKWRDPESGIWPLGQGVSFAAGNRDKYRNTGSFLKSILNETTSLIESTAEYKPLKADASLAKEHRTVYPIVQGPMTRVSDVPEFSEAVAKAGALPLTALALMNGDQINEILLETKRLCGSLSWGVGIIGFAPQELLEDQLRVLKEIKPPFALVAGGSPDLVKNLEKDGIPTYIHVPTPELLKIYYEQGVRRFIFEGRECGGHIGPLASFALWESMIIALQEISGNGKREEVSVLFAGGIHDDISAAIVATLSVPLVEIGVKTGVLMGTAYLFTKEVVQTGAILQDFQDQALNCSHTVSMETRPGHSNRCAASPFTNEFINTRRQLLKGNIEPQSRYEALENINRGRLRLAAKGFIRDKDGNVVQADKETLLSRGSFMIGQVGTIRNRLTTLKELHKEVSEGSARLLEKLHNRNKKKPQSTRKKAEPSDIAIIGMSLLVPKAQSPEQFWRNILDKVEVIQEVPRERWDWRLFYDSDRFAKDKVYSKWGGFIDDIRFDPLKFGIPPNSIPSIEPMQLILLEIVSRALDDSGYGEREFDRENTSVIIGANGGMGDVGIGYALRAELPRFVGNNLNNAFERLPEWSEESFAGLLPNVMAGRTANRFNLGGMNISVDAACASSLAAIDIAVKELETGRSNLAVVAGVDALQGPFSFFCFSKTQALSPTGKARPFDKKADGIVISEGFGALILKRLPDAKSDGDKIYAVIKGLGSSSDGRARSLYAPHPDGQRRALARAYDKAGISPASIDFIEAHATGTSAGDEAEVETIIGNLKAENVGPQSCAISSLKAQLGHTKSNAGIISLIKTALSLHYKVIPPHVNLDEPLDPIAEKDSPVYLLKEAVPWINSADHPRRAALSAFGFGGTNFHGVLEEFESEPFLDSPGAFDWTAELILMKADDNTELLYRTKKLLDDLNNGAKPRLRDLAFTCVLDAGLNKDKSLCLSIVTGGIEKLKSDLNLVINHLNNVSTVPLPGNVFIEHRRISKNDKLAFIFPGQGAQYTGMVREVALYFSQVRRTIEEVDEYLDGRFPKSLSRYIFPRGVYSSEDEETAERMLKATQIAQPALSAIETGFLRLVADLNLKPDMVCGHSYGEINALYAAGVLSIRDFLNLAETRGRIMAGAAEIKPGTMAAIKIDRGELRDFIKDDKNVVIANHNSPQQSVISGSLEAVEKVAERLRDKGYMVSMLPVAAAFHSPLFEETLEPIIKVIQTIRLMKPRIPVYSNTTALPYPQDEEGIADLLSGQLLNPVEFVGQINNMYADGARVFVELGPKSILTNLTRQILGDRESVTVSFDGNGGGLSGLLTALGKLAATGVDFDISAIFNGRDVKKLNLSKLVEDASPKKPAPATWLINGGSARPLSEDVGKIGKLPALTLEELEKEKSKPVSPALPQQFTDYTGEMSFNDALISYQQTMQKFLELQEKVMNQALSGKSTLETPIADKSFVKKLPESEFVKPPDVSSISVEIQSSRRDVNEVIVEEKKVDLSVEGLAILLKNLVSERTGYPPDMIGIDQNLEADLGIDSIKRVEILGLLQNMLNGPLKDYIKDNQNLFTRSRTLGEVINKLSEGIEKLGIESQGGVLPPEKISAPDQASPAGKKPGMNELGSLLRSLVSERTGYPVEMLGMDQNLEADLGIDSIKRVEIIGSLQNHLTDSMLGFAQKNSDKLAKSKTLQQIVDLLISDTSETIEAVQNRTPEGHAKVEVIEDGRVPRYMIKSEPQSLPLEIQSKGEYDGSFILTRDSTSVSKILAEKLMEKGAEVYFIEDDQLTARDALDSSVGRIFKEIPEKLTIIHLAGLKSSPSEAGLKDWKKTTELQVKGLFNLLQAVRNRIGNPGEKCQLRLIVSSMLGGTFGRNRIISNASVISGGNTGMLKCLLNEWDSFKGCSLDFDDTLSPKKLAEYIYKEIGHDLPNIEVGFPGGKRTFFKTVEVPVNFDRNAASLTPDANWVILITGGARGITAETALELAAFKCTVLLAGRSQEPGIESPELANLSTLDSLRAHFLREAKAKKRALTPVQVEDKVRKVIQTREMRLNIQKLKDRGARVRYLPVDVRDEKQLSMVLKEIYSEYGRLDAVIHGAGVIEDKLLSDKSPESFSRVFDTKVDSAFLLYKYLQPESLKLLVFFSSVAGRYGNKGQADYAAANEVLNRMAHFIKHKWEHVRVVSINWGPWDKAGMVTPEVRAMLLSRGINPVTEEGGKEFFKNEILSGKHKDVEVIAGRGPWSNLDERNN